jgi:general secretion pathway protein D
VSNATDVEVMPLKHAIASDLAPLVVRLIESGSTGRRRARPAGQADTSFQDHVVAEPRSNTLMVRAANPARLAWCARWSTSWTSRAHKRRPAATSMWST